MSLPFGRHRGRPLSIVPGDYLLWLCRAVRMSSRLRETAAGELARRDVEAPAPEPRALPACRRCGPEAGHRCRWVVDRLSRRHLRAECARCGRFLAFVPTDSALAEGAEPPAPSPTGFVAWRRAGCGARWEEVGSAESESAAWDVLLGRAAGDKLVLAAGRDPNRPRRERRKGVGR